MKLNVKRSAALLMLQELGIEVHKKNINVPETDVMLPGKSTVFLFVTGKHLLLVATLRKMTPTVFVGVGEFS